MKLDEAVARYAHIGGTYDGGWGDKELIGKAKRVLMNEAVNKFIAETGLDVLREHSAYDSGFEAGVLATEAGLGRADE